MNELRDFGDKYDTRRNREADLIQELYMNMLPPASSLINETFQDEMKTMEYRGE